MPQQKGAKRAVKVAKRKRKLTAKAKVATQKRLVRQASEDKTEE
jgi:hypothetical protein